MSRVETLRGSIETSQLGFTLMHEHIFAHSEGLLENFPSIWNKEEQVAIARKKLRELANLGVQTIVDQTVLGLGRNIPLILQVAGDLPINVIVATGIYYEIPGYFLNQDIEVMVDLFIRDIKEGIQGTNVKAGVVKAATDEPGVTPGTEKSLRAVARAHRRTGVPLYTHTHFKIQQGLEQQDIFEQEGVDLSRVIIGHAGDSEDIDYQKRLMDRGSFIGMDRFGVDIYVPTSKRVAVIAKLNEMGYTGKMVLSHDTVCYTTYIPWEQLIAMIPNRNFRHISQDVIPALLGAGVTKDQIQQMTVENPRRIFENSRPY
jgi:phosphotriesterase-related protein